jgi:hypothetical protein
MVELEDYRLGRRHRGIGRLVITRWSIGSLRGTNSRHLRGIRKGVDGGKVPIDACVRFNGRRSQVTVVARFQWGESLVDVGVSVICTRSRFPPRPRRAKSVLHIMLSYRLSREFFVFLVQMLQHDGFSLTFSTRF